MCSQTLHLSTSSNQAGAAYVIARHTLFSVQSACSYSVLHRAIAYL